MAVVHEVKELIRVHATLTINFTSKYKRLYVKHDLVVLIITLIKKII